MRLPRNLKMMRGPVDAAAMAGTVFLLWVVTLLHSSLVLPAGIRLQLPAAEGVWGSVVPQLALAVDPAGRLLFEQQLVAESNLVSSLRLRTAAAGAPPTLLMLLDRSVPAETLARLVTLARSAGVGEVVLATSPRPGGAAFPVAEGSPGETRP